MRLKPVVTKYLLCGKRGLSMKKDAMELAKEILHAQHLSKHPDFLLVELGEKKELTVEDVEAVIQKAAFVPAVADSTVVIIDSFESMNTTAQNKLLKTLEDGKRLYLILIAYGMSGVLPTVASRCTIVRYSPLSLPEWEALSADHDFCSYYATEGCLGMLAERSSVCLLFQEVWKVFEEERFEKLLPVFHLLAEDDKASVATSSYVSQALLFLNACTIKKMLDPAMNPARRQFYLSIEQLIGTDIEKQGKRYSKNNFFILVARIVSLSKGGK